MKYILLLISFSLCLGCAERAKEVPKPVDSPETPAEAMAAIVKLYQDENFSALIRKRYAEIGKAKDESQVEALVARFTTRFEDDASKEKAIEIYRSALNIEPALSDDESVATYQLGDSFIKLSRMANGLWGFHL